jgi:ferrous iron transport protein B
MASTDTRERYIKVALAGNPNSGKSTMFNALTGLHQKIANFPGVTVEKKTGNCRIYNSSTGEPGYFEITDLPGTYSLYPKSPDERIPFQVLCDPADESHPDLVVLVADGTNLKRSLFLASQIIDLKIPCIIALNMMDMVREQNMDINNAELERRLGVRVIPVSARQEEGMEELKQAMLNPAPVPEFDIYNTRELAPALVRGIKEKLGLRGHYAALQIAHHHDALHHFHLKKEEKEAVQAVINEHPADMEKLKSFETLERYKVLQQLIQTVVRQPSGPVQKSLSQRIDNVLMHRFWGYLIFLFILFLIFQAIFSLAEFPMNFIDQGYARFVEQAEMLLPKGILNDLIVNGILAGIGGIIIFIPQIALLFMFIAILEDSGYMARVSFLMDKLMRKFGLNGRSVIPLISGVACAVPAVLSTRTIGSFRERLITIFVIPLMSCSARLPVYTLLIALVIPDEKAFGFLSLQGLVMMSLYLLGFVAAIATALLFQYFVKAREKAYFIMELPAYRPPKWSNVFYAIVEKVKIFLFDAGKVIIAISIILWFLSSRGPGETYDTIDNRIKELSLKGEETGDQVFQLEAERLEASYAGRIGHFIEPAIRPLGFDWKIGIALITSFAAREVFVGTMSTIYSVGADNDDTLTILQKMQNERNPETGLKRYTPAVGWSLMLFYAFAMQCMSTMAVVKRETGGWKWPLIQFGYLLVLAYLSSLLVFSLLS